MRASFLTRGVTHTSEVKQREEMAEQSRAETHKRGKEMRTDGETEKKRYDEGF